MGFKSQDGNQRSFNVSTDEKNFKLDQDVGAYKEYAAAQRELDTISHSGRSYRSFAILPDIVAIDILTKYGLDIHAQDFMDNPANLRKLKHIIITDYPLLQTSNIKRV
jgi:hypothetical protein